MSSRPINQTCPVCGLVRKIQPAARRRPGFTGACRDCTVASRRKVVRLRDHPLYATWAAMKQRCFYPKHRFFHRYGGRGITITPDWLGAGGFERFAAWAAANGWAPGLTIDRKDNDGNYEPGNCQWVTQKANSQKASSRPVFTPLGDFPSCIAAAEAHGIPRETAFWRIRNNTPGWGYKKEP